MDTEKFGNEALIFAVSFFVSLLIFGILEMNCCTPFCLFVGILPFVWAACFAFEYDIIYSVKNKEIKTNQRELFLVIVSTLATLQIICLIGYLILRGVSMPLYFWIVVCAVIFTAIVFFVSRIFEKD